MSDKIFELLCLLGFLGIIFLGFVLIMWFALSLMRDFDEWERERKEFERRYFWVMKYGSENEKLAILLEAQNRKLEDLRGLVAMDYFQR